MEPIRDVHTPLAHLQQAKLSMASADAGTLATAPKSLFTTASFIPVPTVGRTSVESAVVALDFMASLHSAEGSIYNSRNAI
jgi:hypothetical protein